MAIPTYPITPVLLELSPQPLDWPYGAGCGGLEFIASGSSDNSHASKLEEKVFELYKRYLREIDASLGKRVESVKKEMR